MRRSFFPAGTAALDSNKVTLIKGSNDIVIKRHRSEQWLYVKVIVAIGYGSGGHRYGWGISFGGKGRLNQLLSIKGKLNLYTYPYKQYFI